MGMLKTVFIAGAFGMMFTSCDVRKKDKLAATPTTAVELKDPTTVQLIDSIFDFGSTEEGKVVEHNYQFKNTGTKPLVVSNVHASCGCTVADKPEKPILPGEMGSILVKFNSEHRPGEAHKTVTVSSNASPAFPELLLKGTVVGKEKE